MKLFKLKWTDENAGGPYQYRFYGSHDAATAGLYELDVKSYTGEDPTIEETVIPTKKDELIDFLNDLNENK